MPNSTLIKFVNDIVVSGLIINDDESDYHNDIELLEKWSNDNSPILNADKARGLIVVTRAQIEENLRKWNRPS